LVVPITLATIGGDGINWSSWAPFLWNGCLTVVRPYGDQSFSEEVEKAFFLGIWDLWQLGLGLDLLWSCWSMLSWWTPSLNNFMHEMENIIASTCRVWHGRKSCCHVT
jgi:hypothetical protein